MSKTLSVGVLINGLRNVIQRCAPLIYHNSRGMHDEHFMCIMICVFSSTKTFKLWHFCPNLIAFGHKLKRHRIYRESIYCIVNSKVFNNQINTRHRKKQTNIGICNCIANKNEGEKIKKGVAEQAHCRRF